MLVAAVFLSLTGCNAEQIAEAERGVKQAQELHAEAVAITSTMRAAVVAMPDGPAKAEALALVVSLEGKAAKVGTTLDQAEAGLEALKNKDYAGAAAYFVGTAAPLLPPPAGEIAAAAALLLGLFAKRRDAQAKGVVHAIEQTNAIDDAKKDELRKAMPPASIAFVNKVRGKA